MIDSKTTPDHLQPPVTLAEKLERSKSTERIDYSEIGCEGLSDPLVEITSSERVIVEPFWELPGDFEGERYADYITEHPEYQGVYLRPELKERVERAAVSLDPKYKLVVRAGHRPGEVQKRLLMDCVQDYKQDNPGVSDEQALAHARTFVSDPDISPPPHCCGAAIDVDLFDTERKEYVDFGSPMNADDERSYLHYGGLTQEQQANRMMLLSAMLDQGLASVAFEWWHFSYGDETWAWFYRQKDSLYGLIEPQLQPSADASASHTPPNQANTPPRP